jgi:lipopolysaccharide export LptBFGC system permease protein LptF
VVSINLRAAAENLVLRRRAEIMLGLLAMTLAASAALVTPGRSREALGLELMPIALVYITLSSLATSSSVSSVLGLLSAMLAIWILFFGLGIEQRER